MSQVYLVQTDTTVGFLSQSSSALNHIKERTSDKEYLSVYASFKELKKHYGHLPNHHKKEIRRAKKTTYIVKKRAFRVVQNSEHAEFVRINRWFYSTSANKSTRPFELAWCEEKADIIVYTKLDFESKISSKIYRLHKNTKERLR